jgi:hypothetical protein
MPKKAASREIFIGFSLAEAQSCSLKFKSVPGIGTNLDVIKGKPPEESPFGPRLDVKN